jgi:hypothetical protein
VRIRSGGEEAIITGDAIHHPCQMAFPEWRSPADTDAELAEETRRGILADARARGVMIIGTHFAPPAAGHVHRGEDGRDRLVPARPDRHQ